MNDICIHCGRKEDRHFDGRCYLSTVSGGVKYKSISQHYAELRGPENLGRIKEEVQELKRIKSFLNRLDHYENVPAREDLLWSAINLIDHRITVLNLAIEASKPPKE